MNIVTVHKYNLETELNRTVYSTVYRAYDETAKRTVCIKEIDVSVFNCDLSTALQKIETEIKALVSVGDESTHVPCLLENYYDKDSGKYYIVMQYVKGDTLRKKMDPFTPKKAFLGYIIQLCRVLERMHRMNFYHKDIKPENIMINSANEVLLLDFNISISNPNLEEGTPNYRAPEMERENFSANRQFVDTFAIGVMLYEFFTGVLPKSGYHYRACASGWSRFATPNDVRAREGKPPIDNFTEKIILKCMEFNPRNRYTIQDLRKELEKLQKGLR